MSLERYVGKDELPRRNEKRAYREFQDIMEDKMNQVYKEILKGYRPRTMTYDGMMSNKSDHVPTELERCASRKVEAIGIRDGQMANPTSHYTIDSADGLYRVRERPDSQKI